ncbi:LysR family transcriptional regulator [Variovorax sp. KK3]|uniref:LysR family transcriptional regulator n=1 Tax=Variovorax sp. KK3 TaxID=1855728 RepID=UPI00097C6F8D|nr:LysR family transcriptional regulator [Variovorax sp. KK3]
MGRIHYDLRDVRAICELSRTNGFREAADALSITPSALSRRVVKLEAALGGMLVKRTTRSMALTPLGRRLVSRCQPSLDTLDDSIEELARVARGMEGQISVGCISSVSYALLAPVVARFRASHPDLRINMKEADGASIAAAALNHEVDFGLTTVAERHRELLSERIADDPFVLVCSPRHPLARKRGLTWAQIAHERLMGYKSSSSIRQMLDGQLARDGIELLWFDEVDTLSSLIGYLGTGSFLGVVPRLVAGQLPGLAAVPLRQPGLQRQLYMVRRNDLELTPPARALWSDIRKTVIASLGKRLKS